MEFALIIIKQIIIMFLIILFGVYSYKKDIVTKDGCKFLSNVVLQLVCPILVFVSYQSEYSKELLNGLLWSMLLSVVSYIITIPIATLIFKKNEKTEFSIERFSSIYSNCAFMGFPLIQAIYGTEGIFYTTSFVAIFHLLVWTHGTMVMKNEMSLKSFYTALKSPTIIAVIVGLVFYVTNIRLPEIPMTALNYIASMNTPLAMLVAGITIAQTNILAALKNKRIYLVVLMKLLVLPMICLFVLSLFNAPQCVFISIVIAIACPTATIGTLFAINYNKNAKYSSEIFAITTLLSAITLPLVVILSKFI